MRQIIVIPVYSPVLKPEEAVSLRQAARIFAGKREIAFAAPESLDCGVYLDIVPDALIRRFDDSFFTSISAYSRLLLTPAFYECFSAYEYMLVYQLDGWVFRDDLDLWCMTGYDYIGAPFFLPDGRKQLPVVGNGGVSLRRISAMLRVLGSPEKRMFPPRLLSRFFRNYAASHKYLHCLMPLLKMAGLLSNTRGAYLEKVRRSRLNQEDVVFYYLSQEFTPDGLLMPSVEEAARFSLDAFPRRFFTELPFCCHAWMKHDRSFWEKYIKI